MGIDISGLRAIGFGRRIRNINLSSMIMLGRQELFFSRNDFEFVKRRSGLEFDYDDSLSVGQFSESLFKKFGALRVESIDASAYEGASLIADFNRPISRELHGNFSLFVDFGSIEHIYNIPMVVNNISKLLRENGQLMILTHSNGFPGHGFYQFSPEFFYSVFSYRNGFRDTAVFLVDLGHLKRWQFIASPKLSGQRSVLPSNRSYYIICFSEKSASVQDISAQQSDYQNCAWADTAHRHSGRATARPSSWVLPALFYQHLRHSYHAYKARRIFRSHAAHVDPDTVSRQQLESIASLNGGHF